MINSVCCIIVSYNPDLIALINIIKCIKFNSVPIIIVDNNSLNKKDFTFVDDCYPIFLDNNEGIAKAQNIGLKIAYERGYEYVLLLDQDSDIKDDFIGKMFEAFRLNNSDDKLIALGPTSYNIHSEKNYKVQSVFWGAIDPLYSNDDFIEVSYLISSGSLINLKKMKEVGFFKAHYFIDYVDIEWGFRALNYNYRQVVAKNIIMNHQIGENFKILNKTKSLHSPFRKYYMIRNSFYLLSEKHVPKKYAINQIYSQSISQLFFLFFIKKNKIDYFFQYVRGLTHGLFYVVSKKK
ncbi:glycosyltransferase family 2 protein [Acinetobacter sp. NS-4]|uniref:glycosyltransferase family 2 protein n=1 Tax=Acinetobacter sp. NS-4 TaxID=3127956 RepID=UPI00307F454C